MTRIEVKSEIAGKVWKIETKVGDTLAEDDVILVLESMKMEIPISSPANGRLIELRVLEEDPVAEEQIVAVIERS